MSSISFLVSLMFTFLLSKVERFELFRKRTGLFAALEIREINGCLRESCKLGASVTAILDLFPSSVGAQLS